MNYIAQQEISVFKLTFQRTQMKLIDMSCTLPAKVNLRLHKGIGTTYVLIWLGDTDKLVELLLNGYEHITDIVDEDDVPIIEAVSSKEQNDTVAFLQSILTFEVCCNLGITRKSSFIVIFQEKRERVHHVIRQGAVNEVTQLLADEKETGSGKLLAIGRNSYGRCTLHIAVLCQQEEIVDFLVNTFPETLHVGDNVRIPISYYDWCLYIFVVPAGTYGITLCYGCGQNGIDK